MDPDVIRVDLGGGWLVGYQGFPVQSGQEEGQSA